MESIKTPDVVTICEWFDYNPDTGILMRLKKTRSDAETYINPERREVHLQGCWFNYATLCWIVYYKRFPSGIVDHKNRISVDHRIENLREATPTQNQQNKAGYGTYPKGVAWRDRKNPWLARIRVEGARINLGSFSTMEEAAEAYKQAAIKYHGEFACYG